MMKKTTYKKISLEDYSHNIQKARFWGYIIGAIVGTGITLLFTM